MEISGNGEEKSEKFWQMKKRPIFSVITPTYNREHFLARTIDSILSQTFKDFELIIVDDGSTDHTRELIDRYKDLRIVYFYKENGGQNSAINAGLQKAKGEYIAFCDSDDTWMPEKLEKCMKKYQEDEEIKVVYNLTGIIKAENGAERIVPARDDSCEGWCYKEVIEQGYLTSPSFLTCKKECFDVIGILPNDVLCQDDDLCFRLCKYFKVGLVREILGVYNVDASDRIMLQKKRCADDYVKFLGKWSNEMVEVCGIKLLVKKYLQASWQYVEIDEADLAKDIYCHVCELEGCSVEEVKNKIIHELHINQEILIYGTGYWGEKIYRILEMLGFQKFIFVVTHTAQMEDTLFLGVPVKGIKEMCHYKEIPLIIASSDYYDEMCAIAEENGFYNNISCMKIKNMIFDREE